MKAAKRTLIVAVSIIAIVALILSFSGCAGKIASSMVEKAIENAAAKEGQNIDVDLENGQVNVTDESGNEMSLGGTEIPSDWPLVVPVNDNITIQFAAKNTTDNKQNWTISGTFTGTSSELYDYYKGQMSSWNQDSDSSSESDGLKSYYYQVSNDQYIASIIISDTKDEGVTTVMTVTEK
jgi:hypothetical protein